MHTECYNESLTLLYLISESANGANAALYIIQMLHHSDVDTKLEASRQVSVKIIVLI